MDYFEYRDLAPIDNIENGDKYIEALTGRFKIRKLRTLLDRPLWCRQEQRY